MVHTGFEFKGLTLILPLFYVLKCLHFMSAACIQVHFRLDLFKEANNLNQTAPKYGLDPYCLQYRLPKNKTKEEGKDQEWI